MRYRQQIRFYMNGDKSGILNGSKPNFDIIDDVVMSDAFFVGGEMYLKQWGRLVEEGILALAMDNRRYKTMQNPKEQKRKRVDERYESRQAGKKVCSLVFLTDLYPCWSWTFYKI